MRENLITILNRKLYDSTDFSISPFLQSKCERSFWICFRQHLHHFRCRLSEGQSEMRRLLGCGARVQSRRQQLQGPIHSVSSLCLFGWQTDCLSFFRSAYCLVPIRLIAFFSSFCNLPCDSPDATHVIVKRALSKMGQLGYNMLWSNCEHFASWCRYGMAWSEQVDKFMRIIDR